MKYFSIIYSAIFILGCAGGVYLIHEQNEDNKGLKCINLCLSQQSDCEIAAQDNLNCDVEASKCIELCIKDNK